MIKINKISIIKESWKYFFFYFVISLAYTLSILTWSKHSVKIENIFIFFTKLVPFYLALIGICCFPAPALSSKMKTISLLAIFAIIWCYFTPKIFYFFVKNDWEHFYLTTQMYIPYLILSLTLSFRLGGGKIKDVFVFGFCAMLFMLSGIEDLFFLLVNKYPIPELWTWAEHMRVRLGKVPNKYEAYAFISVHLVLILVTLYVAYRKKSEHRSGTKNVIR